MRRAYALADARRALGHPCRCRRRDDLGHVGVQPRVQMLLRLRYRSTRMPCRRSQQQHRLQQGLVRHHRVPPGRGQRRRSGRLFRCGYGWGAVSLAGQPERRGPQRACLCRWPGVRRLPLPLGGGLRMHLGRSDELSRVRTRQWSDVSESLRLQPIRGLVRWSPGPVVGRRLLLDLPGPAGCLRGRRVHSCWQCVLLLPLRVAAPTRRDADDVLPRRWAALGSLP